MHDPTSTPSTLCQGSPRARSTRSIGDPLGLDRLDRKSIGDPLGLDRSTSSSFLQVLELEPLKSEGTSSCSRKFPIFLSRGHRKWTSPAIILVGLKCHHENHLRNPAKVKPGAASFSNSTSSSFWLRMHFFQRRHQIFSLPFKRAHITSHHHHRHHHHHHHHHQVIDLEGEKS